MGIEKLIERLKQKDGLWCSVPTGENLIADAATALSTLQAENEKLRAELERTRESLDFARTKDAEIVRLGTELEQVKRERDAAQSLLAERIGVRGAEPITTAFGLPIDRLRELAQADREGRCVVLPKDGMVYYIEEAGGEKWIGNKPIQQVILRCGFGMALFEFSLFDKGKYFSRAEAEAALRREQDGNNK